MSRPKSISRSVLILVALTSWFFVACSSPISTSSNPPPVADQPAVVAIPTSTPAPVDELGADSLNQATPALSDQGGGAESSREQNRRAPAQAPALTPIIPAPTDVQPTPATQPTTAKPPAVRPTAVPSPTPLPPEPPVQPVIVYQNYVVRSGDTLNGIAARTGVSVNTITQLNGVRNPNALSVGQVLHLSATIQAGRAPADKIIPDSEAVYSPAYANFDLNATVNKYGGYLARYTEDVEGDMLTGPQIIQRVAERFSVGTRVLLTILEMESGWVTRNPADSNELYYPMGYYSAGWSGLYRQAWFVANKLNEGYYGRVYLTDATLSFVDGTRLAYSSRVNPGTAAIQNLFAYLVNYPTWQKVIGPNGFSATYRKLFGDPVAHAIEPLVPANLAQPNFRLPWEDGHTWYYTGGPHGGWADGSAWAAVDFAPTDGGGTCTPSAEWSIAIAPGKIAQAEHGRIMENLAGTNFVGNGWSIMYMHQATVGRVAVGTVVKTGDHLGHPSCEGGVSYADHLHIARLYNGQWIAAADRRVPFVLSGWRVGGASREYDGSIARGDRDMDACDCRDVDANGIVAEATHNDDSPTADASAPSNNGNSTTANGLVPAMTGGLVAGTAIPGQPATSDQVSQPTGGGGPVTTAGQVEPAALPLTPTPGN